MSRRLFLIGPRGSGKTSVGRLLADVLGYRFYDTDAMICARCGCSIKEIVETSGWQSFRQLERDILRECATLRDSVVGTGGGAVLHQDIWRLLKTEALVIHLGGDLAVLRERISRDRCSENSRPSLTGSGVLEEYAAILAQRLPFYRATADYTIDTSALDVSRIVTDIVSLVGRTSR